MTVPESWRPLAEALPDVRVGLASGPVLAWEGDLYGAIVNLARE